MVIDKAISVYLANAKGEANSAYPFSGGKGARDVIFMHTVPENFPPYRSWVLEITDASDKSKFQFGMDGVTPKVLHWDGFFQDGTQLLLGHRYFVRLLLLFEEKGQIISSPWSYFDTVEKVEAVELLQSNWETIALYIVPSGAAYASMVKTQTQSMIAFPTIYADVKAVYEDMHTLGMRFEATSNTLIAHTLSGFFYSDFSLFYMKRLKGAPMRAPIIPVLPPNLQKKGRPLGESVYGKRVNWEVGVRLFYTVLRSIIGNAADAEMVRSANGLSLITHYDHGWGAFRASIDGELGYSVFNGRVIVGGASFGIGYDRFSSVFPMLQVRYQGYMGKPPSDQYNADTEIMNHVIMGGLMLNFKL